MNEAAQEQVADAMQTFIEDQMEDPTTGDVLGGRKAIVQERAELTERPDNRILLRGASWPSLPDVLHAGGVHMDLDYVPSHLTKHNGSASQRADTAQPLGMLKSILKNVVPEQQFGTEEEPAEGVSAVAAIAKAQAEGQRVFHVTQDNLDQVMTEISISQASREDIQRAVSQFGYEAVVHEAPITVPGWRGSGYILTNPETGAGSYMIDGGENGAFAIHMLLAIAAPILAIIGVGSGVFVVALALIAITAGFIAFLDNLRCYGGDGEMAIKLYLVVAAISLIPGPDGLSALRFFMAAFIGTNGLSAGANAVCSLPE
ncbi:hypothetical protein IC757_05015 [Wenzhouxiangella sp. AB-CW3]|uniref:hypothetical protein n=1 Tax=Wenzhouxiangella sp. AB-CW3 TaxID=2771012 RepID=UPI00168BF75F|nr:hypothetical protein [Wenzhouxiangella sp. AB-CW3]QOC23504.1 hypothetical protein IC757_05015 [Wenzhouxiangella sp. AB-CW3]